MAKLTDLRERARRFHTFEISTPFDDVLTYPEGKGDAAFVVMTSVVHGIVSSYGRALVIDAGYPARVPLHGMLGVRTVADDGAITVRPGRGVLIPPRARVRVHVVGSDGRKLDVELVGLFPRDVA